MLRSIFYARFHSERGPVILRQHPEDDIFRRDGRVQFSDISNYIIPPYELCNTPLSITVDDSAILGVPISIEDVKYPRNRFTFNVCFVIDGELDDNQRRAWDAVVSKTAAWFKCIELEQEMLSSIDEDQHLSNQDIETDTVSVVLRQVFEQLNLRQECRVRLNDIYVLNLRLHVQADRSRHTVQAWEVPLLVATLPDRQSVSWDLVLQQIHAHIDGVNHVKRIAELADAELDLVQCTIGDLIESERVIMLDIFHFQAVYTPTEAMAWFVKDQAQLEECCNYVAMDRSSTSITAEDVLSLYFSFQQGVTVSEVCIEHKHLVRSIDIRRLVTFGVIKGILRRLHKYARLQESNANAQLAVPTRNPYEDAVKEFEQAWKQAALSSGWATPPATLPASIKARAHKSLEEMQRDEDAKLRSYLDGKHCFDQICVEMGMTEAAILDKIKARNLGEITYFAR